MFFLLSTLPLMTQISGESACLAQKSSVKKLPISKVKSILRSNFDLNQIWTLVLTQSH